MIFFCDADLNLPRITEEKKIEIKYFFFGGSGRTNILVKKAFPRSMSKSSIKAKKLVFANIFFGKEIELNEISR